MARILKLLQHHLKNEGNFENFFVFKIFSNKASKKQSGDRRKNGHISRKSSSLEVIQVVSPE